MIKVEELKIGNVLQNIHGALIKVDCIKKLRAKDGNFYLINGLLKEHLSGVVITEEILLKCGDIKWLLSDREGYYVLINNKKIRIEFVHSLQNIYLCIEQKELNLCL